jgi:hypothetical protein
VRGGDARATRWLADATLAAVLLLFLAALAQLQLGVRGLIDGDGYFHARAAQQLAEHGVRREFPQAAFSTWRDHYSDKDFLFHAFLIPFVGESASVRGAKLATIAADALVLAAFGLALMRLRVRFAWAWVLLFAASDPWIWLHLLHVRPHLLGLALLLIETVLVLERRWKGLALASAAHVLAHTSFLVLPALPIAHALACRMRGRALSWRPALGAALGIGLASLLHPYFPNNLTLGFDQVVEVARSVAGTRPDVPPELFGDELRPLRLAGFLKLWPVWASAAALGAALLARWRRTPPSVEAIALFGFAAALFGACLLANRFAFFFVPVAALAAGRAASELAEGAPLRELARRPAALAGVLALGAAIALGALRATPSELRAQIGSAERIERTRPAIAFLSQRAAPSDVVYHNFWRPFAPLYYFRPNGRYIEGLDPIFLYRFDPGLFAGMLSVYRGTASDPYRVVAHDFGARFVFVEKFAKERAMVLGIARDPRFVLIYQDLYVLLFEVRR